MFAPDTLLLPSHRNLYDTHFGYTKQQ